MASHGPSTGLPRPSTAFHSLPSDPFASLGQAAQARAAGLNAPADREIRLTGAITAVHAACIDVIPRLVSFVTNARKKALGGFGGPQPGGGTMSHAMGQDAAGRDQAQVITC